MCLKDTLVATPQTPPPPRLGLPTPRIGRETPGIRPSLPEISKTNPGDFLKFKRRELGEEQ